MRLSIESGDVAEIARSVADALLNGGVAVIPTDTVYGLACLPAHPEAVRRIFELKQRPAEQRLPVIVGSVAQVAELGIDLGSAGERVAAAFWPGALTIAVGAHDASVDWLEGRDEVALRIPAFPLAQQLAELAGPFLMTSANAHGAGPRPSLDTVLADLSGEPDIAVDGGELPVVSSTLVNVNLSEPKIEREGVIPSSAVLEVLRG